MPPECRLDLGAGETPLVRSRRIGPAAGLQNLFFKLENGNPTGSYKDRFAAVGISHMLAAGKTRCVATSSGNSGAALAAHCAAAGIRCEIAVIETSPDSKLNQMRAYGASIYKVRGFGLNVDITQGTFDYLERLGQQPDAALQISAYACSPIGMEGVKTISYELAEQFSVHSTQFSAAGAPLRTENCELRTEDLELKSENFAPIDHVFSPVGGGGLTLAVARGFEDMVRDGMLSRGPRIECVQPEGNDTVSGPLREGQSRARAVECTSRISGLQVPSILDGNELIMVARRSGGNGHLVSDEAIWAAQARLAREEGIFCEPAGAAALAGALDALQRGLLDPAARVVCLVTGSGFKDAPSVERMVQNEPVEMVELAQLVHGEIV